MYNTDCAAIVLGPTVALYSEGGVDPGSVPAVVVLPHVYCQERSCGCPDSIYSKVGHSVHLNGLAVVILIKQVFVYTGHWMIHQWQDMTLRGLSTLWQLPHLHKSMRKLLAGVQGNQ
jgi:hypothetical protein